MPGASQMQRVDIIDSYDPRIVGRAAKKGTLFRYVPSVGDPELLIKADDTTDTNWATFGSALPITVAQAGSVANVNIAAAPANLDGVVGVIGDLWLLKNQAAPAENGVYTFNGAGNPLTRAATWDTAASFVPGRQVFVDAGTPPPGGNDDTLWANADYVTVLGVSAVQFVRVSSSTVVGDPNTMAFFDGAGALTDSTFLTLLPATFAAQSLLQFGTLDPFARPQQWITFTNSVHRMGAWESDGDAFSKSSEGHVVYGDAPLTGNPISAADGGYARVKHNRFGLFAVESTLPAFAGGTYYWRVDPTHMFMLNNDGATTFEAVRANGALRHGVTATGGAITVSADGTQAHGSADTNGIIRATAIGCHAFGQAQDSGLIEALSGSDLAFGFATGVGSQILANSPGSLAHGYVELGGSLQASGYGAQVSGYAANTAQINASNGAHAHGSADTTGSIDSSGTGSHAHGNVTNSGTITCGGSGAHAHGNVDDSGNIQATGAGVSVFGDATGANSRIRAITSGSLSHGVVSGGASIRVTGSPGSHAHGSASDAGVIQAQTEGSHASGVATGAGSQITTSNAQAGFAKGYAEAGGSITAFGLASFAMGRSLAGVDPHRALGDLSAVFGESIDNQVAYCFAIGKWADISGDANNWVATDPLFVAGNGVSGSPANAWQLDKDGKVTSTGATKNTACRAAVNPDTLSARTDRSLFIDTSVGAVAYVVNMPAGEDGLEFFVKDIGANASVNNITFTPNGLDTMEAGSNIVTNGGARHFQFFNGVWRIMGGVF